MSVTSSKAPRHLKLLSDLATNHRPQILMFPSLDLITDRPAHDQGLIPGLGRSPGEGNGKPLQYSCLENSMDGGACQASVRGGRQRVGHEWVTNTFTLSDQLTELREMFHLHLSIIKGYVKEFEWNSRYSDVQGNLGVKGFLFLNYLGELWKCWFLASWETYWIKSLGAQDPENVFQEILMQVNFWRTLKWKVRRRCKEIFFYSSLNSHQFFTSQIFIQ